MKGEQEARMVGSHPGYREGGKAHRKHKGGRKEGGTVWRAWGWHGLPLPPVWTAASLVHIGRRIRPSQRPDQSDPLLPPED